MWAVADGAGGHQAGENASGLIKEALEALPPELSRVETGAPPPEALIAAALAQGVTDNVTAVLIEVQA